jgi:hypothetical protein
MFFLTVLDHKQTGSQHYFKAGYFFKLNFQYFIQPCFVCRPSNFTASEDAGIKPRTVATSALAVKRDAAMLSMFCNKNSHTLKGTVKANFYLP